MGGGCNCVAELERVIAMQSPGTCAVMRRAAAAPWGRDQAADFDDLCATLLLAHRLKRAAKCGCGADRSVARAGDLAKLSGRVVALCSRVHRWR